jgi:hypothetical protein
MGTTLTGTTPQDTYDSLIKVTDNGPLSGTAKYLSDGLGNDSLLAVSTASGVGVGTTNVSTYDAAKIGTSHRFLNLQSGSGAYAVGTLAGNQSSADSRLGYLTFVNENNSSSYKYAAWLGSEVEGATANQQGGRLIFATSQNASSAGPIERMRITGAGNVGIGTSAPNLSGGAAGSTILTEHAPRKMTTWLMFVCSTMVLLRPLRILLLFVAQAILRVR